MSSRNRTILIITIAVTAVTVVTVVTVVLFINTSSSNTSIATIISAIIGVIGGLVGIFQFYRSSQLDREKKQFEQDLVAARSSAEQLAQTIVEVQTSKREIEYYWETSREAITRTLFATGIVDETIFTGVPANYIDELMKRYVQEHNEVDIEYQEKLHILRLRTVGTVQHIKGLLEPVIEGVANGRFKNEMQDFEDLVEKVLQSVCLSIGFGAVNRQNHQGFAVFLADTGTVFENLRVPDPLTILASSDFEISKETIENLRHFLVNNRTSFDQIRFETQIVILLLFCDWQKLYAAKRDIAAILGDVYARDVVIAHYNDVPVIVASREPERVLRRFVLSQVNLAAVAPYIITGPTPVEFFFGREHELREIANHLLIGSYIIIGGRRIGKTSIVRRLHAVSLPQAGFRTLYYDCSTISSYAAFLAASLKDWQPAPPTNAPATFGELIQHPPGDRPLILLLDEADKLIPLDRKNGWQIFNTLRALINSKQAQVVLSGERTLRDALRDTGSPLFNFANDMLLGPLKYSDVEEIVTRPMKQLEIEIVSQAEVTQQIYDFTSGHPNIVQRLCRRLLDRLNERGSRIMTVDDVAAVIKDPKFQEIDFLKTYWEDATPLEKIITLAISQKVGVYSMKEVRQLVVEQAHIQPGAGETKDALDRLVDLRTILKQSSAGYSFAVEAFPRVVVSTTTVGDLLEVYAEEYNKVEQEV